MKNPFSDRIALCTAVFGILLMVLAFWLWEDALLPYHFGFRGLRSSLHELLRIAVIPARMVALFLSATFDIYSHERPRAFIVYVLMLACQGLFFFGIGMVLSISYSTLRDLWTSSPRGLSQQPSSPQQRFLSRRSPWGLILAVVLVTCWVGAVMITRRSDDSVNVASCANHFIQLRGILERAAEKNPDFILPATFDTRAALSAVSKSLGDNSHDEAWLNCYASACPESYWRDRSIGYVYVGDGLGLGDVHERRILILFCPAESHRRSQEHCHGWCLPDGGICVKTNEEMIEVLEHAIARGESGNVSYSPRAMDVLREELRKRK